MGFFSSSKKYKAGQVPVVKPRRKDEIISEYGCYVVSDPGAENTIADVVFVHGLNGHRYRTWATKDLKTFWPRDMLAQEASMAHVRVITFGYDAGCASAVKYVSQNNSIQHADNLLLDLQRLRRSTEEIGRPIIFVAHSLGGIIVKQALDTSKQDRAFDPRKGLISRCTYGVIFLGTPHQGGNAVGAAEVLMKLARVSMRQPNTNLIEELKKNSPTLMIVSRAFVRMLDDQEFGYEVHSYLEGLPTAIGKIVDATSATIGHTREQVQTLRANHMDLARFASAKDENYRRVRSSIEVLVYGAHQAVLADQLPKTTGF